MLGTALSAAPSCSAGGQERAMRRVPSLMAAAPQAAFLLLRLLVFPLWNGSALRHQKVFKGRAGQGVQREWLHCRRKLW